ncbi:MAG TPA: ribosome biogenesis GTP-binding protein YihA/YsxC [Terriglobales bacterium]|jgi:GTP-binding protein|nr:ribosome biogenesis GTP-binding protein YihA/YsxC [Terriglobales bacterium]
MRVLSRFLTAATDVSRFPAPTLPEVAFLGRSNVGKSSVINSLLGSKVARTSSTPGRTQSINFFEIRWAGKPQPEMIFADLPGYGYARVPKAITSQWNGFIEPYIQERPTLALCVALVDLNVPPQPSDKELLQFLQGQERPFLIVGTKSDKLSNNQSRNALTALAREFSHAHILSFSAKTGAGKEELWKEIRAAAGAQ